MGARDSRDRDPSRADSVRCPYSLGTHHPQICAYIFVFLPWRERIFVYGNVADGKSPAAETCVVRRRSAADFFCVRVPGRVASVIRCRTKRENGRCRNRCDRVYYGGSDMCGDMVSDAPDLRKEIGTSTSGEFAPIKDFFNT